MSAPELPPHKPLVASKSNDHNASHGENLGASHDEMTSIRGDLTSFTSSRDDGVAVSSRGPPPLVYDDVIAAALEQKANAVADLDFAGGCGSHTVLSVLAGEHSIGGGILQYFDMGEANVLRLVCPEMVEAVKEFPWMDPKTRIKGSVKVWRKIFPYARAVNVSERNDIVDADFVHIRGDARVRLHTVDMRCCNRVTDAAFVHLRGIHTLSMRFCNKVTDAAFVNLRGIHSLYMSYCDQLTITDAAFVHLRGIQILFMVCCTQTTITDAAFVNLRGIHTLYIGGCTQATITAAALVQLRGVRVLNTARCSPAIKAAAAAILALPAL
jgi:hypothetical protein